ncbi:MurR/RpiR family transcriptional regulator [Sporolactobacillus shoreicorticis]|uniref:MurR/RpiR family transcriptional regulator n=1 Tax=Sporolactobacillus shoreicorticis TaxID=1923877 RepID=A0ABW5S5X0_9BACL|nr:MurR/RpiR family transcriptional regulator [Sporolactobacillus shoreicorticis]MCO7124400.1 MurR/RpiR family transcriptional regulator [Sporolactobacillus shoreicorticis]
MKIEMLIKKYYDQLNENDLSTLHYIIENKKKCAQESITEIASSCNISKSSILRTAQKLGFSGFSEFKYALKNELEPEIVREKNYLQETEKNIRNTLTFFERTNLHPIYERIREARHIYAYGTGFAQRNAASELKRNFSNFGVAVYLIEAKRELQTTLKWLDKNDLLIVISLSGDIPDLLDDLKLLRVKKVPVLSITNMNFERNELASIVPYNLYFQSTLYPVKDHNKVSESPVSLATLNFLCEALSFGYVFQNENAE